MQTLVVWRCVSNQELSARSELVSCRWPRQDRRHHCQESLSTRNVSFNPPGRRRRTCPDPGLWRRMVLSHNNRDPPTSVDTNNQTGTLASCKWYGPQRQPTDYDKTTQEFLFLHFNYVKEERVLNPSLRRISSTVSHQIIVAALFCERSEQTTWHEEREKRYWTWPNPRHGWSGSGIHLTLSKHLPAANLTEATVRTNLQAFLAQDV